MVSKKRLKIAFIHPDLGIGGAERLVLDVAGVLKKEKHEVIFLTNHFDPDHAFEELKNKEFTVEVYGDWLPRKIFGRFQALCAYIRMVYLTVAYLLLYRKQHQPDLYFIDLIPISVPFLRLANQKVVYYCHHPDLLASPPGNLLKRLYRIPIDWLELRATALADIILVNSEYTASMFKQTFPQIKKPIKILYPTVAYSFQQSVKRIKEIKPIWTIVPEITFNPIVFLSINRFHPAKKLEFAIYGMEKLKKICNPTEWQRIYCVLAGGYDPINKTNEETFNQLSKLVKQKNLQDKIIFIKSPSDKLKVDLLTSCTALLYTPLNEHFGIVPLEAMLASKPVIAMNSGGPRETVDHGRTGYLCEPTADSLAEFMYRLTKEDYRKMGNEGRKRLEAGFSYENFARCLNNVIYKFIDKTKKSK
ncbi:alpha-1,3/1,6-mannosyltransferase ALG2 [Sitophilus oryzae]|uniref:Alpha-1,3/1,6-mannosyltransferase ALG2 n=1 Tax=Sitophilus oryzae TaxID=7048 RepID=A0A6J2XAH3_SITOR|nr:alpha-1,3/1,6-mannosyltransferase ALG2 [Sitophilus oryzae]